MSGSCSARWEGGRRERILMSKGRATPLLRWGRECGFCAGGTREAEDRAGGGEAEGRAGEVRQEEKASLEALGSDSMNWSLD